MGSYLKYRDEELKKDPLLKEDARKQQNLTQKELSERTGITQADISRIENGTRNPSLEMIKRLARGMGMVLKLEFVPDAKAYK